PVVGEGPTPSDLLAMKDRALRCGIEFHEALIVRPHPHAAVLAGGESGDPDGLLRKGRDLRNGHEPARGRIEAIEPVHAPHEDPARRVLREIAHAAAHITVAGGSSRRHGRERARVGTTTKDGAFPRAEPDPSLAILEERAGMEPARVRGEG